jgi:hypothetical protein
MIRDTIPLTVRRAFRDHYELEIGKPREVCIVKGCQKTVKAAPGRVKSICPAHDQALWRKTHPITAQYARLKAEAKKRKKPFDITPAEWAELCRLTRYHEGTASLVGSVANGLTIDRIRHTGGYTLDNVRVIVNHLNSQKGAYEMRCRLHTGRHVILRRDAVSVADLMEQPDPDAELERLLERL